ncbi:MAG: hypothetical protein V7749_16270 [Cocleimonas sp.]
MTKNLNITKSETMPDALIPITIGITGHRDIHLDNLALISEQLKTIFKYFKKQYPDSPLILISPLAEGADQLVANIANELQIDIYAVLPMPEEEYKKDFDKADVKSNFEALLLIAAHRRVLTEFNPETQRSLCYANVGKWVVDQCDVLIALWDGNKNELTGGTGEIVNYALTGELPSLEQHLNKDWIALQRPVLHIESPRQSGHLDTVTNTEINVYHTHKAFEDYKQVDFSKSISEITSLKNINDFNREVDKQNRANGYPLLDKNENEFPDHLYFIHELYLKTDLVANEFQATLKRYTFLFYSLTTALMITLLLYFRILPLTIVLAIYVLIYIATILISIRIKNSDYQQKYHLYRIIGELSRLFFFFSLSKEKKGKESIKRESVLNNYRELQYITRKLGSDNEWVVDVLRKIKLFETLHPSNNTFEQPMLLVKKHWIEDQYNYFTKAQARDEKKLRRLDLIGIALFAISLLCGISLFIISLTTYVVPELLKPIVNMIIAVSAGFGGIIKTYTYTMGYGELSGRYKLMSTLFGNSLTKMNKKNSNHDAVFEQLWWEAVMENVEWFSLKNSRLIKTIDLKKIVQNIMRFSKSF